MCLSDVMCLCLWRQQEKAVVVCNVFVCLTATGRSCCCWLHSWLGLALNSHFLPLQQQYTAVAVVVVAFPACSRPHASVCSAQITRLPTFVILYTALPGTAGGQEYNFKYIYYKIVRTTYQVLPGIIFQIYQVYNNIYVCICRTTAAL